VLEQPELDAITEKCGDGVLTSPEVKVSEG
jgi:hypothetical protein